jgi:thiosulfate/3-mercaptopyruvate sulfurtransferase
MTFRTLISTHELDSRLREGWLVVDCRYDLQNESWGREEYLAAHVPGAAYASLGHDLAAERTGANGRHPVPSVDALAATLGRLGISRDHQVVAYDQDSGMYASRLWWSLRYLGHDAVAVLDGGWAKWTREGRGATSGDERRPAETFVASPRPEMLARVDEIATAVVGRRDTLLVDARAPERFEGRIEPIDRVAGHIPGAVNHHFKSNLNDEGTMLPAKELRDALGPLVTGHAPARVIVYCGSGVTACHNLLALEHAGLPGARLYAGSWSEWSSDPARPVETGPASR